MGESYDMIVARSGSGYVRAPRPTMRRYEGGVPGIWVGIPFELPYLPRTLLQPGASPQAIPRPLHVSGPFS
jgi:hypothetical protein